MNNTMWLLRSLTAFLLVATFASRCRPAEHRTEAINRQSEPAEVTAVDPLQNEDVPASRLTGLCEAAVSRLDARQKQRCAQAHLEQAAAFLKNERFIEARSALAFAETEGASLSEVRSLRRQIPGYADEFRSNRRSSANVNSPEANRDIRRSAAIGLTITFASSSLRDWDIKTFAAGRDCDVLLLTFYVKMEDPMIQAVHTGGAIYGQIVPGGVGSFAASNGFRGVIYRDGYDTTWAYGNIAAQERDNPKVCS